MRIKFLSILALLPMVLTSNFINHSPAFAAICNTGSGIGVHRTINLDTKNGVRYGTSHGRDRNFLKDKEVVLTFDDGPVPGKTTKVLHELDKHCAKATFFMVATMARNSPSLTRKIAAKGHTIGFHSYSHKRLNQLSGKVAVSDVKRSIDIIKKAAGHNTSPFFRFPYLAENRAVNNYLGKRDYGVFAIDVDSLDYRMPSSSAMVNRVMSELRRKGKGIILMHDIQNVTANGIGALLTRLNDEGYKLVHIKGRGGRDAPEPLLMADANDFIGAEEAKSIRQGLMADNLSNVAKRSKPRNAAKKRPKKTQLAKLDSKPKQNTSENQEIERASFLFSQAFRKSIKTRMLEKQNQKASLKKAKVAARIEKRRSKTVRVKNQRKSLKNQQKKTVFAIQAAKNKAAFRKAIKRRLLTN